ncbi:tripartite tricarboxylate transporter TctB family protein [Parendozoicomonas haliclonae]|uniref:Tripartite tricarboxylate transporter TctB family protein n=2 Tax=Parendozoicomonas haliclonae TaxID=1960125 RepID=A0A1X7ARF3_9GAMM|nr:Tripartite tricarboxylate transporter TctB family protein [Parendozoicomonas haliclonae]
MIYGAILLFALVFLFLATQFQEAGDMHAIGSGFYPILTCFILAGLCIMQLVTEWRTASDDQAEAEPANWQRALMVFAVLAVYGLGMMLIGYLPATILGFMAILFLLGVRRWTWYLAAPVFSFALSYIFAEVFMVFLPAGSLFQ